jgi:hypothetical protein
MDECGKSPPPPTGIKSPDLTARNESLYRLRYPGLYVYTYIPLLLDFPEHGGSKFLRNVGIDLHCIIRLESPPSAPL